MQAQSDLQELPEQVAELEQLVGVGGTQWDGNRTANSNLAKEHAEAIAV